MRKAKTEQSHRRLHLPSSSRRMTPRAQKGLVIRGYNEVMQNKCPGEYLLRSSFDAWIVWPGVRPAVEATWAGCIPSHVASLHLETSKYNGQINAYAVIYCPDTRKSFAKFQICKIARLKDPALEFHVSPAERELRSRVRGVCLSLIRRLRERQRFEILLSLAGKNI